MKKLSSVTLATAALVLAAMLTPSASVRSQLAPLPGDPAAALQSLQQANADLLKRQETTLKEIEDLAVQAREARIFARRG